IERDPFFEAADAIAAHDLPEAREAWLHAETAALGVLLDARDLVNWQRTRADEAHFAAQDVDELGQFINAELAQPAAKWRDARIVFHLEDGAAHFVVLLQFLLTRLGIHAHGAELEHAERAAIAASAILREENRSARSETNADHGH